MRTPTSYIIYVFISIGISILHSIPFVGIATIALWPLLSVAWLVFVVIGIPDAYRGESAKAFVKLREGSRPMTIETLTAFLDGKVGRHEMPKEIEVRAFLPRTAVGKLSKKDLREEIAASQTSRKMP